ncbi:polymorphic toxin-type HINT domain-containing protein [Lacipirellula parvula]|uniref:polymorphic toxin-type HINT domain-containing protein n=1 Tax=Lacipirellula parvula TaxID=2650471 RepID=UPI0015627EB3|nr:polymorphic toxin-type HINT domain-containing protein [Lacipirellula parvula]
MEQALTAGLAGDQQEKTNLLKRASSAEGDFAPARWQLGEIKFDGEWRTPAEVAKHVAADERWQKYEGLREGGVASIEEHVDLAEWCMRQGLTAEEKYHWANVILANPNHHLAQQRLGMREVRGRLYTQEWIDAETKRRDQAKREMDELKPKYLQFCREATGDLKVNREKGLTKLRAINDPAGIPALREAVRQTVRTDAGKKYDCELVLAMTAALAKMPEHAATIQLTGLAVYSKHAEVRRAAAAGLQSRQVTDYVPLLMQLLQAPVEVEVDVVAAPDGMVRMIETVSQQKPFYEAAEVRATNYEVEGALNRNKATTDPARVLSDNMRGANSRVKRTRSRVENQNAALAARNERVQEVLRIASGLNASGSLSEATEDVTHWWGAWQKHNELSYDSMDRVYESYLDETFVQFYEQAPPPSSNIVVESPQMQHCACFAPDTLVWKQSGPTPIELVRVGDLVLAKHPTTGELGYRPVLETTRGRMTQVLRVELPGESVVATLGHRFWVEGVGWRMAKELKAEMPLHTVRNAVLIKSLEQAEDMECCNLVVDEFHTFVIGQSQILVHDITCPQPTLAITPGLLPSTSRPDVVKSASNRLSAAGR